MFVGLENSMYNSYIDQYTKELMVSLPIIFVLGLYTNKRFGSLYSMKLLAASYGMGHFLKYTGFGSGKEAEGSSLNIASALVAHTVLRIGLPFSVGMA